MVPASGIERSTEIVGPFCRPVIGMAEQRLGDSDMLRVVDPQFGRDHLAEQVRIQIATEITPGPSTDDLSDLLRAQRLACAADPKGIASDRVRRARHEKRMMLVEI